MTQDDAIQLDRSQRPEARQDPRLDWWRDAKFGMFIHWGLYAIPAGEWQGKKVPGIGEWLGWTAGQRVTQLLVWVLAGIVTYFVALRLAGLRLLSLWRQEHPS